MSSEVAGQGQVEGTVGLRELVLARRVGAYAFFVVAGWVVMALACGLVASWGLIIDAVNHPLTDMFWMLVLPGPAAALGAAAVHRPFMRSVHNGRAPYAHGWAVGGVLAAHVAYAALLFVFMLGLSVDPRGYRLLLVQHDFSAALAQAGEMALAAGVLSLMFGFLPNVLIAEIFAGVVLYLRKDDEHSQAMSEVQLSKEGGRDASAAFAE